jgi:inorganic pyrophosphatase
MRLDKVTPGDKAPDEVNVIIEIPLQSLPVKYEVNKKTGAMFVDRFLTTAMHYPCNYGYIPRTLADDGDPADVLVIAPFPIITGAVIRVRPIGLLQMTDEAGEDSKLLAVPINKLSNLYREVHSYQDICSHLLDTITHFFEHYKDLEKGKWVKINQWEGPDAAREDILNSIRRYEEHTGASSPDKPNQ